MFQEAPVKIPFPISSLPMTSESLITPPITTIVVSPSLTFQLKPTLKKIRLKMLTLKDHRPSEKKAYMDVRAESTTIRRDT